MKKHGREKPVVLDDEVCRDTHRRGGKPKPVEKEPQKTAGGGGGRDAAPKRRRVEPAVSDDEVCRDTPKPVEKEPKKTAGEGGHDAAPKRRRMEPAVSDEDDVGLIDLDEFIPRSHTGCGSASAHVKK